jgi:hypothetical protein
LGNDLGANSLDTIYAPGRFNASFELINPKHYAQCSAGNTYESFNYLDYENSSNANPGNYLSRIELFL